MCRAAVPEHARQVGAQLPTNATPKSPATQALVLRCCLERGVPAAAELAGAGLKEEQREFVLALRGLLAYGVLEHCLRMRVHVEFGINRCGWGSVDHRARGAAGTASKVAALVAVPC